METLYAIEHESFKLYTNGDFSKHNFVPKNKKINITACKNSTAAFQVVLLSDSITAINLGTDPYFSQTKGVTNIRLLHNGELSAQLFHEDMHNDDDNSYYADALLRQPIVQVKEKLPHSIYVEIPISKDTVAKKYNGKIELYTSELFENEVFLGELCYTVEVFDVCLPDAKDREFKLDLWQHNSNIARKAEVALWSDRHFEIIEQYVKTLADLGQRAVTVIATEIPWCGQRCFQNLDTPANLFEYSMIRVEKNDNGEYSYDYSAMDRYIELCFKHGIDKEIEVFGILGIWQAVNDGYYNFTEHSEGIRIRYKDVDNTFKYMQKSKDIEDYIVSLAEHFKEKKWIDRVRISVDEPWEEEIFKVSFYKIRELVPEFKYKSAIGSYEFLDTYKNEIAVFVPSVLSFLKDTSHFLRLMEENEEIDFLWYICCSPSEPNAYLHSNLLEARYLAVLTHFFGFNGLLRWSYNAWPEKPREDIRYSSFATGDTNFVYPAGDMSPLLTIRYKMLNRAIEDFELLRMAKRLGKLDAVNEAYERIITNRNFSDFYVEYDNKIPFGEMTTTDVSVWDEMRKKLYEALEK